MKRRHAKRRAGMPKPQKNAATQQPDRTVEHNGPAAIEPAGMVSEATSGMATNDRIDPADRHQAEADLQAVRNRLKQLEAALACLIEEEKACAGDLFDRLARDRFVTDRKAWLADPETNLPIFAASLAGAEYLARVWHDFRNSLDPKGPGPTFEIVVAAIAALGSPWRVATARDCGVWLIARFAAISADPERAIARWVRESAAPDDTRERAMWRLRAIGEPVEPRRELVEFATAEMAHAIAAAETLRARHAASRAAWVESSVGSGSADPALEKRFRGLHRLIATERSRADRLDRRLNNLNNRRGETCKRAQAGHSRGPRATVAKGTEANEKTEASEDVAQCTVAVEPAKARTLRTAAAKVAAAGRARGPFEPTPGWITDMLASKAEPETPAAEPEPEPESEPELAPSIFETPPESVADRAAGQAIGETWDIDKNEPPMDRDLSDAEKARARLTQRTSRFRILEWGDPYAVAAKDVEVLKAIRNMPESIDREAIVRLTFGCEKTLRRAWRGYMSWRDTHEPSGILTEAGS